MIIGFVGFGEAAAAIAEGLHEEGAENLICFDAMQNDPRFTEKLEAKRAKAHARRKQTPADVCREADIVMNWESFIFREDIHQEAFTVGLSTRFKFNDPDSRFHFYAPLQVLAQHRGGEIDTILTNSVQTLMNGAVGIGGVWNTGHKIFKSVNVELDAAGYYQQAGKLWSFDNGYGVYARASADIYDFRVKTSYWRCHQFISMFGSPFYGAVSTSDEGLTFDDPSCVYFGLEYSRELAKGFSLGIDLDIYEHLPVVFRGTEQNGYKSFAKTSFSAGIYLRVTPSFLIKKF